MVKGVEGTSMALTIFRELVNRAKWGIWVNKMIRFVRVNSNAFCL